MPALEVFDAVTLSAKAGAGEKIAAIVRGIEISFDIRFLFAFPVRAFVSQKETRSIWEDQLSKNSRDNAGGSVMDGCAFAMRAIAIAMAAPIHSDARGGKARVQSRKRNRRIV